MPPNWINQNTDVQHTLKLFEPTLQNKHRTLTHLNNINLFEKSLKW